MSLRTIILDHLRAHGPAYTVAVVNAVSRAAVSTADFYAVLGALRSLATEGAVQRVRLPVLGSGREIGTAEGWEVVQ